MTTQPEALRLADALQHLVHHRLGQAQYQSAAELRRQHSRIAELEAALEALEKLNMEGWILADFEDMVYAAIERIKEIRK